MGELLVLVCVIGVAWLLLKLIGGVLHLTFAMLALPFQILAAIGAVLLAVILIVPFAIFAGVLGILLAPLLLIAPLLPVIIIGIGLMLLLRRDQSSRHAQPKAGAVMRQGASGQDPAPQP